MGWTQNNDEIGGMGTTFSCPRCGAPCMSYDEAQRHCQHSYNTTECRTCCGTGQSNGLRCPDCNGTGKVIF